MSAGQWFCQVMGTVVGPLSADELRQFAADGRLAPDSLVKKGADANWVTADRIRGLFDTPQRPRRPPTTDPSIPRGQRDSHSSTLNGVTRPARPVRKYVFGISAAAVVIVAIGVLFAVSNRERHANSLDSATESGAFSSAPAAAPPVSVPKLFSASVPVGASGQRALTEREQRAIDALAPTGTIAEQISPERRRLFVPLSSINQVGLDVLVLLREGQFTDQGTIRADISSELNVFDGLVANVAAPGSVTEDTGIFADGTERTVREESVRSVISPELFQQLAHMRGLRYVVATKWHKMDRAMPTLASCSQLLGLDLSWSDLTDEGVSNLPKALRYLNIANTRVTANGYAQLRTRRDLEWLSGDVDDNGFIAVCGLPKLRYLSLDAGHVTNVGFRHIRELKTLEELYVRGFAKFDDAGCAGLGDLQKLSHLDLTFCKIGDVAAQEFGRLNALESVVLARTGITDMGLAALSNSPKLRSLKVDSTKITGAGIRSISQLQNLESLDLDNTGVDDPAVTHLVGFRHLRELYLGATRITDNGVKGIAGVTSLRVLRLRETGLTDQGLMALTALGNLIRLDVKKTSITPAGIKAFKAAMPKCNVEF